MRKYVWYKTFRKLTVAHAYKPVVSNQCTSVQIEQYIQNHEREEKLHRFNTWTNNVIAVIPYVTNFMWRTEAYIVINNATYNNCHSLQRENKIADVTHIIICVTSAILFSRSNDSALC